MKIGENWSKIGNSKILSDFDPLTNSILVSLSQTAVQSFIKFDSKSRLQERIAMTDRQTDTGRRQSYKLLNSVHAMLAHKATYNTLPQLTDLVTAIFIEQDSSDCHDNYKGQQDGSVSQRLPQLGRPLQCTLLLERCNQSIHSQHAPRVTQKLTV